MSKKSRMDFDKEGFRDPNDIKIEEDWTPELPIIQKSSENVIISRRSDLCFDVTIKQESTVEEGFIKKEVEDDPINIKCDPDSKSLVQVGDPLNVKVLNLDVQDRPNVKVSTQTPPKPKIQKSQNQNKRLPSILRRKKPTQPTPTTSPNTKMKKIYKAIPLNSTLRKNQNSETALVM